MKKIKIFYKSLILLGIWLLIMSCKKFLDERSVKNIVIPTSYEDLMALMDANSSINHGIAPGLLEVGTDDYYLTTPVLNTQRDFEKASYLWMDEPQYSILATNLQWTKPYLTVFTANTVLDYIDRIKKNDEKLYNKTKGTALFLRAYSYFHLAQAFSPAFDPHDANDGPGIPLRLDPDVATMSVRSTVKETYERILFDLEEAKKLLPISLEHSMRPSMPAAYAALAKVYLAMGNYEKALFNAEAALALYDSLTDYKVKNTTLSVPFNVTEDEIIFFAKVHGLTPLSATRANIDTILINSYEEKDLRKKLFFTKRSNGTYAFKGSYTGFNNGDTFIGLTVSELYLIKAECFARKNELDQAKNALKYLLDKRFETPYEFSEISSSDVFLEVVLKERRKEMLFRGVRWSDLRRLNRDPRFAKTLRREVINGGDTTWYYLPPNDERYTFMIPQSIIQFTNMPQNKR